MQPIKLSNADWSRSVACFYVVVVCWLSLIEGQLPVFLLLLLFSGYQFFSCATGRRGDGEWDGSDGTGVRRHARTERSSAATVEREGRRQLQTHVGGTTSLTCYDQDRYPNDIITSLSHFSWLWCSMVWTFMWLVSEVLDILSMNL